METAFIGFYGIFVEFYYLVEALIELFVRFLRGGFKELSWALENYRLTLNCLGTFY
jgi:hypothetical protein